jgi:hypothetical protein
MPKVLPTRLYSRKHLTNTAHSKKNKQKNVNTNIFALLKKYRLQIFRFIWFPPKSNILMQVAKTNLKRFAGP